MRRNGPPQSGPSSSSILYIGLIPFEWDEENLKSVVCGTGNVLDVRLGFDHVGKNKGYAFVEFETPQQAYQAKNLLSQVQILHPGSKTPKRLRIELSKEGFRTGNNENKRVIPFNMAHLPPSVQLPQEVIAKFPQLQQLSRPPLQYPMYLPNNGGGFEAPMPQPPAQQANWAAPVIPERYSAATKMLPHVAQLPFATPDKINQTLSQIPPTQLIELIANLKNILSGPGALRAPDVFQISPALATTAAQALLLMGLIDEEVIQEAMKAGTQPPPQNVGGYNKGYSQSPPPAATQSKWPHLPLSTQMKLGNLPPDQAELIAQVLSLPADQINSLPPDRQQMVASIRQQYL